MEFKSVRFTNRKVAQDFIQKFDEEDRDIFIIAPFEGDNQKQYWGIAIVATSRDEEIDGYERFIKNCKAIGARPRYVFLNRIDAKLIRDDKVEKVGLPWIANPEGEEIPIDILEPISDEDITGQKGEGNEPAVEGEEFNPEEAEEVEPAEEPEDLTKKESVEEWARDMNYLDGVPLCEDVIPINKAGLADGRFGAVRKYAKAKKNVEEVKLIDLSVGNGEEFLNWFRTYAEENKIKEGVDYSIVVDLIKILNSKLDTEIIEKMQEFGVKLKETESEQKEQPVEDIEEFDIPEI